MGVMGWVKGLVKKYGNYLDEVVGVGSGVEV